MPDVKPSWVNRRMTSGLASVNVRPSPWAISQTSAWSSVEHGGDAWLGSWYEWHHPRMRRCRPAIWVFTASWCDVGERAMRRFTRTWSLASSGMTIFVVMPDPP